jgi:hypothetical protein
LEFTGNYSEALSHYQRGVVTSDPVRKNRSTYNDVSYVDIDEHNVVCQSGLARMSLRVGEIVVDFIHRLDGWHGGWQGWGIEPPTLQCYENFSKRFLALFDLNKHFEIPHTM